MIVTGIPLRHLHLAWLDLWPMLELAVKRAPGYAPGARPDVLVRLIAGDAQLWAILEDGKPVAAVVTQITFAPSAAEGPGPEKRCLLWLIGGGRVREWAADFLGQIEAWARTWGCVAIWGAGRSGWSRIVRHFGGERIADVDGEPAWERRIA
jgi:hypothetical protein